MRVQSGQASVRSSHGAKTYITHLFFALCCKDVEDAKKACTNVGESDNKLKRKQLCLSVAQKVQFDSGISVEQTF